MTQRLFGVLLCLALACAALSPTAMAAGGDLDTSWQKDQEITLADPAPWNLDELKQVVDVRDPRSVAAYWVWAVNRLVDDYDDGMAMMKYLYADIEVYGRGFTEGGVSGKAGWDSYFNERLKNADYSWLPRAYFKGASADNGFKPPRPLTVELHYNSTNTDTINAQTLSQMGRLNIVYWLKSNAGTNRFNLTLSKFEGSDRWYVTSGSTSGAMFFDQRSAISASALALAKSTKGDDSTDAEHQRLYDAVTVKIRTGSRAAAQESGFFSAQLAGYAKALYDGLNRPECVRQLAAGGNVVLNVSAQLYSQEQAQRVANDLAQASTYAFAALELEHMDVFWITGSSTNIRSASYGFDVTVTPRFGYNWQYGGRDTSSDYAAVSAAAKQIAAEAAAQGSAYEQLLYVHDWLTTHNVYNEAAAYYGTTYDYLPWTPLSALTDVSQPVCEGYAKAFKLICDELGIPCVLVCGHANGGGHAWNEVKLGEKWYAVDVTFDDPTVFGVGSVVSGAEKHDYFLVGANTYLRNTPFSVSHPADGSYLQNTYFNYPALSFDAYGSRRSIDPAGTQADDRSPAAAPESDGSAAVGSAEFADVSEDDYYYDAVEWAYSHKPQVTGGMGDGTFGANGVVTRAQAMTFLWRTAGCPEPETAENPFADVRESDDWYKAVLWANERGIANGTGDGMFSPEQTCSTAHIITFLYRAMGIGANGWYQEAADWAESSGLLDGVELEISPSVGCPRKDIMVFMFREMEV